MPAPATSLLLHRVVFGVSQSTPAILGIWQHSFNLGCVGSRYDGGLAQFSFPPGRFLRQDVTRERMMALDLSCPRYFEALGCALMRF